MAPQTRSMAKSTPGRSTRNSVFGRPPLSLTRKNVVDKLHIPAQAQDTKRDAINARGNPWLACRDAYGVPTTVSVTDTGEGVHIRWHHPEEDEDDFEMVVDEDAESRDTTPVPAAGPRTNIAARHPFPQTPMADLPYDAGSVIRTPVKKAKPIQRSPQRIGDKGIRCHYEKDGVLMEGVNGPSRVVLHHPIGSTANLSREQVEMLEREQEARIISVQIAKLQAEKRRLEEEDRCYSECSYGDEPFEVVSQEADPEGVSGFPRGPNGELLDHNGRQILGREGTVLVDPTYVPNRRSGGLHRPRFGPEGTELID